MRWDSCTIVRERPAYAPRSDGVSSTRQRVGKCLTASVSLQLTVKTKNESVSTSLAKRHRKNLRSEPLRGHCRNETHLETRRKALALPYLRPAF